MMDYKYFHIILGGTHKGCYVVKPLMYMFDPSAITEDIMRDIVRDTELEQKLLMVSGHTIVDIINGHFVKKPA